ncbi:hypothetical protein RJ55_02613 [Drechmeria coniospora]|nr:hypothetical protein RJ55_02613 [Drechmeria coniospora]
MGSLDPPLFRVSKIAIIGAGPAGLATAKYLRDQGDFESIVVFEQQDEVGGIWNYSDVAPGPYPVPQLDPFFPPDAPVPSSSSSQGAPVFPSPIYDRLHANIPAALMSFSDRPFPGGSRLFPNRQDIQAYLVRYAEDVRHLVRFCVAVTSVVREDHDGRDRWRLEAQSTVDGTMVVQDVFDAVVVANGHYSVPFIPPMANIEAFHKAHPSVITHSKQYRRPDDFKDAKVVVVGNGPSGVDLALQINQVSRGRTILSVRTPTSPDKLAHTGCEEVPEIAEFLPEQRAVRFKDGRVDTNIDAVVFCTGFLFSYPFLPDLQPKLITNGQGVHGLYKHLISIRHPTLVFPAPNMKSVPWQVSEAQAALVAAVWSNNLALPAREEMERWSRELEEREGESLHVFATFGDGHYINELHDLVATAEKTGKPAPRWDDELFWQRSVFSDAKLRFEKQGCKATTLGELGLHYDPDWRRSTCCADD